MNTFKQQGERSGAIKLHLYFAALGCLSNLARGLGGHPRCPPSTRECDSHVIIDPSTVSLSKTRFPDGGEVKQFSDNDTKGRAGQWYIVVSVQSSKT